MKNSRKIISSIIIFATILYSFKSSQIYAGIQETGAFIPLSLNIATMLTKTTFLTVAAGGISYTTLWLTTLMHELGHAFTAKACDYKANYICMGSHNKDVKSMLTIPRIGIIPPIYIKTFNPVSGMTSLSWKGRLPRIKDGIINACGHLLDLQQVLH